MLHQCPVLKNKTFLQMLWSVSVPSYLQLCPVVVAFQILEKASQFLVTRTLLSLMRVLCFVFCFSFFKVSLSLLNLTLQACWRGSHQTRCRTAAGQSRKGSRMSSCSPVMGRGTWALSCILYFLQHCISRGRGTKGKNLDNDIQIICKKNGRLTI